MTVEELITQLQQMPPNARVVKPDIDYEGFELLQGVTVLQLEFCNNGYICETEMTPNSLLTDSSVLDAVILDFDVI